MSVLWNRDLGGAVSGIDEALEAGALEQADRPQNLHLAVWRRNAGDQKLET